MWQGLGTNKSNPLVSGELLQRDLAAQSRSHDLTPLLLNALLLSAPIAQNTLYGMIMNGREVLFLKLDRSAQLSQYSRSNTTWRVDSISLPVMIAHSSLSMRR